MLPTTNEYHTDISLNFGTLKKIIEWTTDNCDDDWNFSVIDNPGKESGIYRFYFKSEKDFCKFLIWQK